MNKGFMVNDSKDRAENIKQVTFKTISLVMDKHYNDKSNLVDTDWLLIRDTSRILLNDVRIVLNNIKQLKINKEDCKNYLGIDIKNIKTSISSTRDIIQNDKKQFSATEYPKIYKLLTNIIDNYTEALKIIDGFSYTSDYSKTNEIETKKNSYLSIDNIGIIADKIIGDVIIGDKLAIKCVEDKKQNKNVSKVKFSNNDVILEYSDKTTGRVNIDEKGDYTLEGMFYFPASRVWKITNPFNDIKDIFTQNKLHNLDDIEYSDDKDKIVKIICDNWNKFNKEEKEDLSKLIIKL